MAPTKADIESVLDKISSGDIEALKSEEFEQFQYVGFDPFKLIGKLMQVKNDKSILDGQFQANIYAMVAIGMIKGNVNERNIKKMSDKGQENLKNIMSKYGIKMGGGRNQASDVITFPRVMAAFPDVAIRLVSVIGPKEFRGGPMRSVVLPAYMQNQVFPAVIPKTVHDKVKEVLLTASLCYSIDQTIQISEIIKPDLQSIASTQMNYVQISFNSPVALPDTRIKVFSNLTVAGDYQTKIVPILQIYKDKIDPDYTFPDDKSFKTFMLETK